MQAEGKDRETQGNHKNPPWQQHWKWASKEIKALEATTIH